MKPPLPPSIMTPGSYLQTDEATLLEIAPHWRLLQVFPREPREVGYNCGAMFYIGVEEEGRKLGIFDFGPESIMASTVIKPSRNYGPALRLNVIATSSNPDAPNLSEWSTCGR